MPRMDGISALKKIQHSELTESPVIAVTAFAEETDRISFLKMGFSDFITKPIRPKEFLESIASHLSRSKKNSEDLAQSSLTSTILDKSIIFQLMKYNSQETIKAVIRDFLLDTSSLLKKLEIGLAEKNGQDLLENLHILKGNSGTLGANSIYLIAKDTEAFIRANNWTLVEEGIAKLNREKSIFETHISKEFIFKL
jgi:two-component system, OmpR family, alkaline phosphatase synthesis response regulator PhoP